jgi:hypothetical protein
MAEKDSNPLKIVAVDASQKSDEKNNYYGIIPGLMQRALFVGTTLAGKTNLMTNLLTREELLKKYFHSIFIFSPNIHNDPKYNLIKRHNDEVYLFDEWDSETIYQIFEMLQHYKKEFTPSPTVRTLFIVDDFADDKTVMKSKILKTLFIRMRHLNVSTWVCTQSYKAVPDMIRTNAEFLIVFIQNDKEAIKIAEETAVGKYRVRDITRFIERLADTPYSFMVFNRTKPPNKGRFMYGFDTVILPE